MKYAILTLLICLPLQALLACETYAPYSAYYSASPTWKKVYPYNDKGAVHMDSRASMRVSSCREEALNGKFLMVGFGASYAGLSTSSMDVSYTGKLNPDEKRCKLYNLPYQNARSYQQRKAHYEQLTRTLNTCGELVVTEQGSKKLKLAADLQEDCQHKVNSDGSLTITGGYCYLTIYEDSNFKITPQMNKKCADSKFLKENQLEATEILARSNLFIAGDTTGDSNDLVPLKSMAIRYSIEPTADQVKLSEDWGFFYPRWPSNYRFPEINWGPIELVKHDDGSMGVNTPFLVNHVCGTDCNFSLPVSAELTLYEVKNSGKKEWLVTWFEGDVAPPQFQGLLENNTRFFTQFKFEPGKRYKLVATFANPKEDFTFLNRGLADNGLRLPGIKLGGNGLKIGSEVPTFNPVPGTHKIPTISEVREFQVASSIGNLDDERGVLGNNINFTFWPPYYDKVCDTKLGKCQSVDLKQHVGLELDFSIKGMAQDNKHFLMDKIRIARKSSVLSEYDKQVNTFPYLWCK